MKSLSARLIASLAGSFILAGTAQAQPVPVSNHSFESQVVNPFIFPIDTRIDSWQKTPRPDWFVDSPSLGWDQTVAMFPGLPPLNPAPYSNLHGSQAAYMLAIPGAGIFQDNVSTDWSGAVNGLNATFEVGKYYQLTLGVFGKLMVEGYSSMQISLYYRSGTNMITIGSPTTIVFSTNIFNPAGPYALIDYTATTSMVQAGDAWAGQNIGIRIESVTGAPGYAYWDMDNVRLTAVPEPAALSLLALGTGGIFVARRSRRET